MNVICSYSDAAESVASDTVELVAPETVSSSIGGEMFLVCSIGY